MLATIGLLCLVALQASALADEPSYVLVGVSGGLQDGFPDHVKMDYHAGEVDEVEAIFVGRALVRGTKAFLDVMQEGWRQYAAEPQQPLINSNVIVSGCHEHANQYWIYAVDSRQFLVILNNEPRFLSITPDTGLVDLLSNHTDNAVKRIAISEIRRQQKADEEIVAFPIVVSVWFHAPSYVPSPPVHVLEDGTHVTNFAASLALWANVSDADRVAGCEEGDQFCQSTPEIEAAQRRYWDGIRRAVREAESPALVEKRLQEHKYPPFACQRKARLGVGPNTARLNYPFTKSAFRDLVFDAGYQIDFDKAVLATRS